MKKNNESLQQAIAERFRGEYDQIKERLKVYVPIIESLSKFFDDLPVIDLGCGRGEFLELLAEARINAIGLDENQYLVDELSKKGYKCLKTDVLEYLRQVPDNSALALTGFHIIEHLPNNCHEDLFLQCKRVLAPGGVLILETPNADNIKVATHNFYLDPTHTVPIPPLLLEFYFEHFGFTNTKKIFINGIFDADKNEYATLEDVLCSVSPDYAVLGQKLADNDMVTESYKMSRVISPSADFHAVLNKYQSGNVHPKILEELQRQTISIIDEKQKQIDEVRVGAWHWESEAKKIEALSERRISECVEENSQLKDELKFVREDVKFKLENLESAVIDLSNTNSAWERNQNEFVALIEIQIRENVAQNESLKKQIVNLNDQLAHVLAVAEYEKERHIAEYNTLEKINDCLRAEIESLRLDKEDQHKIHESEKFEILNGAWYWEGQYNQLKIDSVNSSSSWANELNKIYQEFNKKSEYAKNLEALVANIRNSLSWKLTKPLRATKSVAMNTACLIANLPKIVHESIKQHFYKFVRFLLNQVWFRRIGKKIAYGNPILKDFAFRVFHKISCYKEISPCGGSVNRSISPGANLVLIKLLTKLNRVEE